MVLAHDVERLAVRSRRMQTQSAAGPLDGEIEIDLALCQRRDQFWTAERR